MKGFSVVLYLIPARANDQISTDVNGMNLHDYADQLATMQRKYAKGIDPEFQRRWLSTTLTRMQALSASNDNESLVLTGELSLLFLKLLREDKDGIEGIFCPLFSGDLGRERFRRVFSSFRAAVGEVTSIGAIGVVAWSAGMAINVRIFSFLRNMNDEQWSVFVEIGDY